MDVFCERAALVFVIFFCFLFSIHFSSVLRALFAYCSTVVNFFFFFLFLFQFFVVFFMALEVLLSDYYILHSFFFAFISAWLYNTNG